MSLTMLPQEREIKNTPFVWVDKQTLRFIRAEFGKHPDYSVKRLRVLQVVYYALAETASNQSNQGVARATYGWIAKLASVSISTARRYTERLLDLGVISKQPRNKRKPWSPNIWVLHACYDSAAPNRERSGVLDLTNNPFNV